MPMSIRPVVCTALATPAVTGKGVLFSLSFTNSILNLGQHICHAETGSGTYAPKEAFSSYVANIRMAVKLLVQKVTQDLSCPLDIFDNISLADDALHLQCGSTDNRMALVCVAMRKGPRDLLAVLSANCCLRTNEPGSCHQGICDAVIDHHPGHWSESASEAFCHGLYIGHHAFLLPYVQRSATTHARHDLCEIIRDAHFPNAESTNHPRSAARRIYRTPASWP